MEREIERKFYFHPENWKGKPVKSTALEQGYVSGTGDWEIRLRRSAGDHRYTMKSGSGLNRAEWEIRVLPSDFEALWPQTVGHRLVKLRERHLWKGTNFDFDQYGANLAGLNVVEVEFPDLASARGFTPPGAFGPELTYDPRFKNRRLAEAVAVPLTPPGPEPVGWSFGVLPFRKGPQGWELVVVSTRRGDRWIFPKGQPEPGLTFEKVALAEAREEAGLSGRRIGHPLVLPYVRETGTINLLLFPLKVTALAPHWLEDGQRQRKIVPLPEAKAYGELVQLGAQWLEDQFGG